METMRGDMMGAERINIYKGLPFPVVIFDSIGNIISWNERAQDHFKGFISKDLPIAKLWNNEGEFKSWQSFFKLLLTYQSDQTHNFSTGNIHITVQFYYNSEKQLTGGVLFITILEKVMGLEEKLFEVDELISEIEELSKVGRWEVDLSSNYAYWSEGMYNIFEIPEDQHMYHREFLSFVLAEDIPAVEAVIKRLKEERDNIDFKYRIISAKGNLKYITGRCKSVWKNDKPVKLIGYLQDVSHERKKELLLKGVLDSLFCGLVIIKAVKEKDKIIDFEFVYVNGMAGSLIKKKDNELKGKKLLDVFPGLKAEGFIQLFSSVVNTGLMKFKEFFYEQDGFSNWFKLIAVKHEDSCIVCFDDITESKKFKEKSESVLDNTSIIKLKKMEKLNQELNTFAHAMSHDLRSPINNLWSLMNLFLDETKNLKYSEASIKYLKFMNRSISALKQTIQDLAELPKISEGSQPVEVSIKEIFENVKSTLISEIKYTDTIIIDQLHADRIVIRPKNLHSIFFNLISNAIKYRHPDRTPEIKITSESNNGGVKLIIQDNGMGMQKDDLKKLFLPFRRIHKGGEGTGLGMSIVKKIIEINGGEIVVNSIPNEGTVFEITLRNENNNF